MCLLSFWHHVPFASGPGHSQKKHHMVCMLKGHPLLRCMQILTRVRPMKEQVKC